MKIYDHILLGTGQATGTILGELLKSDESIAVIEGNEVGGSCVNTGCTPTKTLVASAKVAGMIRRADEYGIEVGNSRVNFPKVMARMNEIRHRGRDGFTAWVSGEPKIDFYPVYGAFTGPKQLRVGDETIEGKNIYIHTGTSPRTPNIPGMADAAWLTNEGLLNLTELPEHLIVIGGSYIGLEFSQIFRRFGSKITVLEAAPQIMAREDADVSQAAKEILTGEGIEIHEGVKITQVSGQGPVQVDFEVNGSGQQITGSHVLVAIGRVPNTSRLNLEAAGIETDERGFIRTEEDLQTAVPGVYAIGDVNGRGAFTHTSVHDGQVLLARRTGANHKVSDRFPIYSMFIDPPMARIGLTEKEAIDQGYQVLKATRPMARINRAKEMGETQGFVKILVDAKTDKFLGASILGVGGDEIINNFTGYMYNNLTVKDFRRAVLVHPTVSELLPWILAELKPV